MTRDLFLSGRGHPGHINAPAFYFNFYFNVRLLQDAGTRAFIDACRPPEGALRRASLWLRLRLASIMRKASGGLADWLTEWLDWMTGGG